MLILIYDAVGLPTSHPSFLLGHQKSGWTDPFHRNEWIGWAHPYHARGSRRVVATATTPGMFTATAQAPTQPPPALPAPAPATTNATSTSNATSTTPSTTSTTPATASGATTSKDAASCSTNSAANARTSAAAGPNARTSATGPSAKSYAAPTIAKTEGAPTNGTNGAAAMPPACAACRSEDVPPANTWGGDYGRRWGNLFVLTSSVGTSLYIKLFAETSLLSNMIPSAWERKVLVFRCKYVVHDVIKEIYMGAVMSQKWVCISIQRDSERFWTSWFISGFWNQFQCRRFKTYFL